MACGENMNKRKTRTIAISLGLCLFVCALSVGILASMSGFFAFHDGNDPAVYSDPDVLDFKVNEPQAYANPEQLPHRTVTPSGSTDAYTSVDLVSRYELCGEIPIVIVKFPRLIP